MIATVQPQLAEISTADALWVLIQSQTKAVRKALTQRLVAEDASVSLQREKLQKSLHQAFDELHSGQIKHNARELFAE